MFLLKNGYMQISSKFMRDMEAISYHVAVGNIDKPLLHKLITSFLYEDDYSDELKLELLSAMSNGLS